MANRHMFIRNCDLCPPESPTSAETPDNVIPEGWKHVAGAIESQRMPRQEYQFDVCPRCSGELGDPSPAAVMLAWFKVLKGRKRK